MAIILIADDRATNREFLSTILGYSGHEVVEAADGAEALRLTKEKRPVLAIVDILMPTMDGYEFTRQLRLDPDIAHTLVIFYTATYREQEARGMAKACGAVAVLSKPCEPEEILRLVSEVLGVEQPSLVPPTQPISLPLHDRFFQEGLAREAVSLRLAALVEASLELSAEQDPQKLLDSFTRTARDIIGSAIVTAGIVDAGSDTPRYYCALGIDTKIVLSKPREFFNQLITGRSPIRRKNPTGDPTAVGFPSNRPPLFSVLAVPVSSSSKIYGWLSLANKVGADEFSEEDERLALALTSQVAVIYENIVRYQELQQRLAELENEIKERREVEKKQARLIEIFNNTTDTVSIFDMQGHYIDINRAGRKTIGIGEKGELPTVSLWELLSLEENKFFREALLPALLRDGVWSGEVKQVSFIGKPEMYASQVVLLHRNADGTPEAVSSIARDITERKQLEEKQSLLVSILDNTPGVVTITDMDGLCTYLNLYGRRFLGIGDQEELPDYPLVDKQPPAARLAFDNVLIPALLQNGVWSGEATIQDPEGKTRTAYRTSILHRSPDGTPKYISTIARDITDQKRTEEQLRQAQKMEAIGQLAGGVAHDFNNILLVIMAYSSLLLESFEPGDSRSEDMVEINSAAERAASLTRQLLAFSRQEVVQPKTLELNQIVTDINKMIGRLLGEDINIRTVLSSSLGRIKADPGQIEQVVMNLAVNARDAMPKGGKLTIETSNVELDASYTNQHLGVSAGSYVMLAVSDTGCGMSKEIQSRIFEPFFTTKDKGRGTGLGLSTVYGIVQQSGGHLAVYSEPGTGTTFKVYFPRIDEALSVTAAYKTVSRAKATESVLLVEDDASVRRIVRQILQGQGYKVFEAKDGLEALSIVEKIEVIDLFITDVVMPEISGPEMVALLRHKRPTLKVLYLSGYTDNAISRHGLLDTDLAFLQKPFTPDALKNKVREVLETPLKVSRFALAQ